MFLLGSIFDLADIFLAWPSCAYNNTLPIWGVVGSKEAFFQKLGLIFFALPIAITFVYKADQPLMDGPEVVEQAHENGRPLKKSAPKMTPPEMASPKMA